VKETIMAEPALVLPATQAVAVRANPAPANPASVGRRAAAAARLRCRVEAAPDRVAPDRTANIPQAADDATDYTGFSMVGVAG
jgi:hypothetical protein